MQILIAELCPKYGINIINFSEKPNQYQPNLELWPSFSKNEYLISRDIGLHIIQKITQISI